MNNGIEVSLDAGCDIKIYHTSKSKCQNTTFPELLCFRRVTELSLILYDTADRVCFVIIRTVIA